MKAIKQYKFEEQNLKAAISNCKLWRSEYNAHIVNMPTEIPYKERLLDKLNNAYNMLKSVEFYLDRTAFKNKYQERFSKEKLLTGGYILQSNISTIRKRIFVWKQL